MTAPAPETLDREHAGLFVTDAELIRRLRVPEKIARAALQELDAKVASFPKKQKLWGNRRYWPKVKKWFDDNNGLNMPSPQPRETHRG